MNNLKKEGGFTLIEIVVILAVIAIIAAAMVPRISGIMDDAKISRAQGEVQTIGMAILRFNANTGKWPAKSTTEDAVTAGLYDNQLLTLVSGNSEDIVQMPAYVSDTPGANGTASNNDDCGVAGAACDAENNQFQLTGASAFGDYFDNHLRANTPKGKVSGVDADAQPYPTAGVTRWNGPYTGLLGADPWGNAYICNIKAAYSTSTTDFLYCYVISAGPDGIIQTDANITADEIADQEIGGDDVAFLVRARQ